MSISSIETGGFEVIGSGVVTAFKDGNIKIEMKPDGRVESDDESELSIIFEFKDNGGEAGLETSVLSDNSVKFIILNHRSSGVRMGGVGPPIGPFEPFEVGDLGNRKLFLLYQVQTRDLDEVDFILTHLYYTFYLEGEADVTE